MAKQEKLRSGAVDYGRIYEQKIAAYLAIKCALDSEISDFWILSNVNGVEAFDDIVLMVRDIQGNKKLFCIQLKHLVNSNLQATQLENHTPKNKFSLKKYQDSFEIIEKNITANSVDILRNTSLDEIYLILWTNAPLTSRDKLQYLNVDTIGGMDFLDTSSQSNVYKLNNLPSTELPFNQKFLERFYVFAEQAPAASLDRIIKNEFCSHFHNVSNSVIINITDYFTKWSMGDGKKIRRIARNDVQRMLLEFLLSPHLIEPNQIEESSHEKFDLIIETLVSFNVTPINEERLLTNIFSYNKSVLDKLYNSSLNLDFPWNSDLRGLHWDILRSVNDESNRRILIILQEKKIFVPHLTIKDIYLASWHCRLIPLILNCNTSKEFVEKVLIKFKEVTKDLSFVLLNPVTSILKDSLKIFESINSIQKTQIKNKNLTETFISMQSKMRINLEKFKDNIEILQEVTPDVYLTLMECLVVLGESIETENYYVKRDLRRPILKLSVLDENSVLKDREWLFNKAGDIFLLVEFEQTLPLRYANKSVELTKYLTDKAYQEDEKIYILVTKLNDLDEQVISAASKLHKESSKSVHVMKLCNNHLEWSFSKGTVEALQKHLIETNLLKDENPEYNIPEDDILMRSRSGVNMISNNARMGKTFMLKSLANKFEPDEWVCYINLSEHISKIPQENRFRSYFQEISVNALKTEVACIQRFCERMYLHCLQTRKIICLFDGYDEVPSDHALTFLKEAKEWGLRMWITTRPTYKKELEMHMENLSVEITHFSTEDHVTFLWKYFHSYNHINHYNDTQIQYIIDTINKCSSNLDKTLIALPLQTRMFAEIFGDDINQIDEKEKLTIVDLYNKFVDVKLKEYKSYEATSLKKTLSKLALKLFFTEQQLEHVLDFEDLAEEAVTFQESYKKDSIVIGLNERGDAVFGHRTFAEFLAAYWLAKQIVNRKGEYNFSWLPVLEKLYYIEMVPVRVFFDRILSQNLPLHLAVLNNDRESVQSLLTTEPHKDVDVLGRSALHIAVTYGKYYDLYIAREIKGLRNVGVHSVIRCNNNTCRLTIPLLEEKQYRISGEIVDVLINQGFLNTTDRLFRYDLFDYAMKSCSLNFVHSLFKKFEKVALYFEAGYSFEIFLYCIIHDNLYNILSNRKTYNFNVTQDDQNALRDMFRGYNFKLLTTKYNEMYLTEVAAMMGGKEVIFDLLQSGALGIQDGNIVHKACFSGHSDVLELLYNLGANIDRKDDSNWSPLYQAAKRKRSDLVYQLLKNSKFLSNAKRSSTLMTPLHYAVQGGHLDCVKKLLEFGVKVNVKDAYDNTPLIYACKYGHVEIIDVLLKSGQVDISENSVNSTVNVVAFHGYSDCVKKLLEYGLDVNYIDDEGNTPLMIASQKGFSDVVSALASSENCNLNLMVRNESLASLQMWCAGNNHIMLHTKLFHVKRDRSELGGIAALHFAVRHGHVDCTKTLLDLGADQTVEDEITKYAPLVWTCMYGFEKVLKLLLEGEDSEIKQNNAQIGLIWASMLGYEKCVEVLCKYIEKTELPTNDETNQRIKAVITAEFGTDNWYIRENENMPLLLAAKNGYESVIRTLVSIKYRNNEGLEEALHWAAKNGHLECVKELIQAGADETKTNEKFLRLLPISWASMYGKTNVVEYLLQNKTSDWLGNKDFQLALNWAAVGGHYDSLMLLIDFGLDVDNIYEDLNGGTPLISACEHRGTVEVIDALMAKQCNVRAKDNDGSTALDIAAKRKKFEIVKRFINSGAFNDMEVEVESELYKNLQIVLEWAVQKEEHELIEGLLALGISIDNK
ncbi:uncharacterized protein LOC108912890 [Anoplophora glabripennis]|uniref:uncharacterized protein LOC108912890 n=1 Tax=Anoplophora glabripennis TaxID=217634 RepID=UPI000874D540|nr:uncharacterized protein LOC108912890 [Anoplophora glabripennis]